MSAPVPVPRSRPERVVVVVPAHDEEQELAGCLRSLEVAAAGAGAAVHVLVVLDACSDGTADLVSAPHRRLVVEHRSAGLARSAGVAHALAHHGSAGTWISTTDADSRVDPGWLAAQLDRAEQGWAAVVGTVTVGSWEDWGDAVRQTYLATYRAVEGHAHVHGANLGVDATAYLTVGGFPALATGEDVALVDLLEATPLPVLRTAEHPVTTSARRHPRAPDGFGALLRALERDAAASGAT